VDFLRPRAIPALIAASLAALAAAAECSSLEGTYRFVSSSAPAAGQEADTLADLGIGAKDSGKLYRLDSKGGAASFNATQTIQRPKRTLLAATATLRRTASGTFLDVKDAQGATLATVVSIDVYGKWTCKGARLTRSAERTAGLGDSIRTEKVAESIERNAEGELVYRQTVSAKGVKPSERVVVFPAAR
jgi:hypothetical protein